jgi:Protein of unknown function (DUF664)
MPYFARPADFQLTAQETLDGVLFHPIQETARHAGHADIIRETLDGRRAGQLLEACEAG